MKEDAATLVVFKDEHRGVGGTNFNFWKQDDHTVVYRVSIGFHVFAQHHTSVWKGNIDEQTEKIAEFNDRDYIMPKTAFERIGISIQLGDNDCYESGVPKAVCWFCKVEDPGRLATEKFMNAESHWKEDATWLSLNQFKNKRG